MNSSTESIKTFPFEQNMNFATVSLGDFVKLDALWRLKNPTHEQYCALFCATLNSICLSSGAMVVNTTSTLGANRTQQDIALSEAKKAILPTLLGYLYYYLEKLGLLYNENIDFEAVRYAISAVSTLKTICQQYGIPGMDNFDDFEKSFGSKMSELGFLKHERFRKVMKYHFDAVEENEKKYELGASTKEKILLGVFGFLSLFVVGIPFYRKLKESIKTRNRTRKLYAKLTLS